MPSPLDNESDNTTNTIRDSTSSTVFEIGSSWCGFSRIKHLVVFGASYCDVGYRNSKQHPNPNPGRPLGIEFPGITYTERGTPNWVGHLVTKYAGHREMVTYCYAVGGAMVDGVKIQVEKQFLPEVGKKPHWARWNATDTLFATWVGINDCAYAPNIDEKMVTLFSAQEQLYEAGARNFLFVNLPPIERSPGCVKAARRAKETGMPSILRGIKPLDRSQVFKEWNHKLALSVRAFCDSHLEDITAMIYSSHDTFTRVLDDPGSYGFAIGDVDKEGGAIWYDNLHPTTAMHDLVAKEIASLLAGQPAFVGKKSWLKYLGNYPKETPRQTPTVTLKDTCDVIAKR